MQTKLDSLNYELGRPLPKGKNKKVTGLIRDELGGKIMNNLLGLRAKTYSYLTDINGEAKKAKDTKKCLMKRKVKFEDYKNCLEAAQVESKMKQ